jgi:hypothetical protein
MDLAVGHDYEGWNPNVSVLLGKGDGTFGNAVLYGCSMGRCLVSSCDLDRDGGNDLIAVNSDEDGLSVLVNTSRRR